MAKVILDTVNDGDDYADMVKAIEACGITVNVLNECGGGGGWPEIEYTGSREALEWMINTYFDDGGTEPNDALDFIED